MIRKERMEKSREDRQTDAQEEGVRKSLGHGFESHPDLPGQVPSVLWVREYHAE